MWEVFWIFPCSIYGLSSSSKTMMMIDLSKIVVANNVELWLYIRAQVINLNYYTTKVLWINVGLLLLHSIRNFLFVWVFRLRKMIVVDVLMTIPMMRLNVDKRPVRCCRKVNHSRSDRFRTMHFFLCLINARVRFKEKSCMTATCRRLYNKRVWLIISFVIIFASFCALSPIEVLLSDTSADVCLSRRLTSWIQIVLVAITYNLLWLLLVL